MTKISFHTLPETEKIIILQEISNKQGLAAFCRRKRLVGGTNTICYF